MIPYESFELTNGLRVLVHPDPTSAVSVVNLLYGVGARDEDPHRTGFAHLFEHLMFGGSRNVPDYDRVLQEVGAENNAFTSNDITNYYVSLPAQNIETAFWVESDRMMALNLDAQVLEVQRKVVIEEFKQRYLNQPYGDVWLKLRPLAYHVHPYQWATIGKEISHVEQATLDDVSAFFHQYYKPNNATLVVGGPVTTDQVHQLAHKWFGGIPAGVPISRKLPTEPIQTEARRQETSAKVPANALYRSYHMAARLGDGYLAQDLSADLLGRGHSSHLYRKLVKEQPLFSSLSAGVAGSVDPGMWMVMGRVKPGVSVETAEAALDEQIEAFASVDPDEAAAERVKNQAESTLRFGRVELMERCVGLAYADFLGNPELVNTEAEELKAVTAAQIGQAARDILRKENSSTLIYRAA